MADRKNSNCPCAGCKERAPGTGCHDTCKKFWKWKLTMLMRKAEDEKNNVNTMNDTQKRRYWRNHRYSRQTRFVKGTRND